MPFLQSSVKDRKAAYGKLRGLTIEKEFGGGYDGCVFQTSKMTAIKVFGYTELYERELEIYQYMNKWNIRQVDAFHIPRLIAFDKALAIIEMSVVTPPFIVDFASAAIERPIERGDEWHAKMADDFEDDWPLVRHAIWRLEDEHGIYIADVHPRNFKCH